MIYIVKRTSYFHRNKRLRSSIPFYAKRTCLNAPNNQNRGLLLPYHSELLFYTGYKVGKEKKLDKVTTEDGQLIKIQ